MATYQELYDLGSNSALRNKIAVAVAIKAQTILDEASPTVAEVEWAKEALNAPLREADILMHYVLAANRAATTGQIVGATDSAIQTNVNAAVDKIISGGV